jgi:hypothetical protein
LQNATAATTTATISNLSPNTAYRFSISAVNSAGESARSHEITVNTLTPVPRISGQSLACPTNVFTITNLGQDAVATWTHSPNIQRWGGSGNTATFRASGAPGSGWIQATVNGVSSPRIDVWAGTPFIERIEVSSTHTNIQRFQAIFPMIQWSTINRFNWDLDAHGWGANFVSSTNEDIVYIQFHWGGFFMLNVTATNACGEGTGYGIVIYYFGGSSMREDTIAQSSPISGVFHVVLGNEADARGQNTSYDVRIYNSSGSRIKQVITEGGAA